MNNLCQIVNENDEPIGVKERSQIDWKNDIYRIGGVWLKNSKGEVLIAQRALTKDKDPGKWGPSAAGTVEEGETYESNAYKEAEEELGLRDTELKIGPKQRFYEPRHAFCQWFIGKCDKETDEFKLQEEEVEQVRWIDVDELKKDVEKHPNIYTPSMPLILASLAEAADF